MIMLCIMTMCDTEREKSVAYFGEVVLWTEEVLPLAGEVGTIK